MSSRYADDSYNVRPMTFTARMKLFEFAGDLDSILSRHRAVHQDYVRRRACEYVERTVAIGFSNDRQIRLQIDERSQCVTHTCVIVDEQHANFRFTLLSFLSHVLWELECGQAMWHHARERIRS